MSRSQPTRIGALSPEERVVLLRYCQDHTVAKCDRCELNLRLRNLGSELLGSLAHICPRCSSDLSESVRAHLDGCSALPDAVRLGAREVREATGKLLKQSQLLDSTNMLNREDLVTQRALLQSTRAALAVLREALRRAPPRGR